MSKDEIVFPKADIQFLESAAREVGLDVYVPSDIKLAQQYMPRKEGELEPTEAYLLFKLAEHIEKGGDIPEGFVVYLNDRAGREIQEDVPTLLWRQTRCARRGLFEAVHELSSKVGEKK